MLDPRSSLVARRSSLDVLDLLSRLVDRSLALAELDEGGEARYRMLEPVRQYASARLAESGEAAAVARRHAALFVALAERAAPHLRGAQQVAWLARLEREQGNLRAAMGWLLDRGELEPAVRLAWALWLFWHIRGHQGEGRRWLERILAEGEPLPAGARARALCVAALMSYGLPDHERTARLFEESVALFRRAGDRHGQGLATAGMGVLAVQRGERERASALLEDSLRLRREVGDRWGMAQVLNHLGLLPFNRGDHATAARRFEEGLALAREIGDRIGAHIALYSLARIAQARGEHEQAARRFAEALRCAEELGDEADMAYCLEGLAGVAGARGEAARAALLFGAAEGLLAGTGVRLYAYSRDPALHERAVGAARAQLGDAAWAEAWARGRTLTPEEALEYALQGSTADSPGAELPEREGVAT